MSASACISDEELAHLVDSPLAKLQIEWLDARRWPYELSRRGRPRVARAVFDQKMGVVAANDGEAQTTEPVWPSSVQR